MYSKYRYELFLGQIKSVIFSILLQWWWIFTLWWFLSSYLTLCRVKYLCRCPSLLAMSWIMEKSQEKSHSYRRAWRKWWKLFFTKSIFFNTENTFFFTFFFSRWHKQPSRFFIWKLLIYQKNEYVSVAQPPHCILLSPVQPSITVSCPVNPV